MQAKNAIFMSSLLSLFTTLSLATVPQDFPSNLLYQNKPIDSLCFYETQDANSGTIALDRCGIRSETHRKIISHNNELLQKGYIGYNYSWAIDGDSAPSQGYSYYKLLGMVNNFYVIYAINNNGGSGQFSSLNLVQRENNKLHIETVIAGDRCNNGVFNGHVQNQRLSFHVHLTAFDFLDLTKINPHHLKAYDDLDACAACCIATAVFERDFSHPNSTEKLLYVDLTTPTDELNQAQTPYQACFNKLIANYQQRKEKRLNPEKLKSFVLDFNTQCVKQKS